MNTECIILAPHPRRLSPHGTTVQVDAIESRHILIPMRNLDVARFSMAFSRYVEENYPLDPREKLLVYYSPNDFDNDKLDLVVEELRRWIEEWLENDRSRRSSS